MNSISNVTAMRKMRITEWSVPPQCEARNVTALTWDDTADAASNGLRRADALVSGTLTQADATRPGTLPLSKLGTLPLSRSVTVASFPASFPARYADGQVRHV